jgi:nucleotide-binding universal stress UspA family protein
MVRFRRILAPVDLSEGSRHALRSAAGIARLHGGKLDVLFVWEPPRVVQPDVYVMTGMHTQMLDVDVRGSLEARMQAFVDELGLPATERPEYELAAGDPADVILERAAAGGYDLIVMGTHGRKGISRLLIGSVAEKVVRRAPCPVLTIRPPREALEETEGALR